MHDTLKTAAAIEKNRGRVAGLARISRPVEVWPLAPAPGGAFDGHVWLNDTELTIGNLMNQTNFLYLDIDYKNATVAEKEIWPSSPWPDGHVYFPKAQWNGPCVLVIG